MGGKTVLADTRVVHQAALHHIPAQQALQSAHKKQDHQFWHQPGSHPFANGKVQHGQQEDDTDQASQNAVQVFIHEDGLEPLQAHAPIDFLVFGKLPVLVESLLPCLLRQWRDNPHQRLPLHHGQAGVGQAGDTAQQYHAKDNGRAQQQPAGNLTIVM